MRVTFILIPVGSSKITLMLLLRRVGGIFSLNSEISISRNFGCGLLFLSFWYISLSQKVVKCTFLTITHCPVYMAFDKALLARVILSFDPMAIILSCLFSFWAEAAIVEEGSKPGAVETKRGVFWSHEVLRVSSKFIILGVTNCFPKTVFSRT